MSDNELLEKSNLGFLAIVRQAQTPALERIEATLGRQASLLHKMSSEIPEQI